jgi:hypothetical protein
MPGPVDVFAGASAAAFSADGDVSSAANSKAGAPTVNATTTSNTAIFNNLFTGNISFRKTKNVDCLT